MRTKIGEEAANKLCNEALYFIGIGKQTQWIKADEFTYSDEHLIAGSNDYVNNYLQPFLADGQQFTHDEFVELLISTLGEQLAV